jgi:hypothetical protein
MSWRMPCGKESSSMKDLEQARSLLGRAGVSPGSQPPAVIPAPTHRPSGCLASPPCIVMQNMKASQNSREIM